MHFLCCNIYFNTSYVNMTSTALLCTEHYQILIYPVCSFVFLNSLFTCADPGDCLAYFCISNWCCFFTADSLQNGDVGRKERGRWLRANNSALKKIFFERPKKSQRYRNSLNMQALMVVKVNLSLFFSQINQWIINRAVRFSLGQRSNQY